MRSSIAKSFGWSSGGKWDDGHLRIRKWNRWTAETDDEELEALLSVEVVVGPFQIELGASIDANYCESVYLGKANDRVIRSCPS